MPRMMLVVLAFAAYAVSPSFALAQAGLSGISTSVMTLDKNFDIADRNHDGLLSKDEARAGHVPFIVKNFDAIDTQHRGLVSKDDVHDFIKKSLGHTPPAPASSTKQN
ncbi:MAG: EF-hand domain-containing protein [Rhodanobacter sp.]